MQVVVGEDITIQDCTPEIYEFFRSKLSFGNPEYYKRMNAGRWTGNTPQTISLIERHGADVVIPFGMLPQIFSMRSEFSNIINKFLPAMGLFDYKSTIKPTEYQERAIKAALKARQGVVVAPCGAGKTMIGLEIVARLGGKTLWLTHTSDLLNQSMDRAKAFFDIDRDAYGTITAGKVDIGKAITFATVQTMSKLDLRKIRDEFDVVIVDEAHHVVGTPTKVMMFYRVISNLRARYKFGLTATPERSDGLTPCMYALIGPEVCRIVREEMGGITCQVKVKVRRTPYKPLIEDITLPDGTISYPDFISNIVQDEQRNSVIIDDIVNASGTSLVLTERVSHVRYLKDKLKEKGMQVVSLSGVSQNKQAKQDREDAIQKIRSKQVQVLVATYALAKEGLDIPTLDNLFMATPQKNETVVTQSAGRVARKAEGKDLGTIYDYRDAFGMLSGWQNKRNRVYKRLGYEITED